MARPPIVAPPGSYAVDRRHGGLWILPDLWKTPRARFPQGPWTARQTAPPTGSTGRHHRLGEGDDSEPLACRGAVQDTDNPSPEWPLFKRSSVAAFQRSVTKMVSKNITPGLWKNVEAQIDQGVIISHIEVLREIKSDGAKGEELYEWAHAHENMFKDYEWDAEGRIIRLMSPRYGTFVNDKVSNVHADPWLVAQAKSRGLTVISEEKRSRSADPRKHKLPNVCDDGLFAVRGIDLIGLVKEQGWKFN